MPESLSTRMRHQRTNVLGISLSRLSMKSEIPESTLRSWENGDRIPGYANTIRLAEALGVDEHWLGKGEDQISTQISAPTS